MTTGERAVVTLSPPAADKARHLAHLLGIRIPEVIRRGLSLLSLWVDLPEGAYLAVTHPDRSVDRIVMWD